jgi:hypothetical protein
MAPPPAPSADPAALLAALPSPTAPPATPLAPTSPAAVSPQAQALVGIWENPDVGYRTRITIELVGSEPVVKSARDSQGDQETMVVRSSTWNGGVLTFVYYVPSTQYVVTFVASGAVQNQLHTRWSNSAGASGNTDYLRVGAGGRVEAIQDAVAGPPPTRLVGAWSWGADVKVFRSDGRGSYLRDGNVCYEFTYTVQGDRFREVADRDSGCMGKRDNEFQFHFEGQTLVLNFSENGFRSEWQPTRVP